MKSKEMIFDIIQVGVRDFKDRYNEANKARKAALKRLRHELVPNTPRYRAEQAQIEADFQAALTQSREWVLSEVMPELQSARQRAENALTLTDTEVKKLDTLKRFADIPLAQREIDILAEKYGGGYWSDRLLKQLAEQNSCEYLLGGARVSEKLDALDQLESGINTFLNSYTGEGTTSYDVLRSVSDRVVYELERQFTGGYRDVRLTPAQKARRAVTVCKSQPDFLSKSIKLANSYRNSDVRTRQFILSLCVDDESMTGVLRMAGLDKRADDFKENGLSDMKKAIQTLNEAQRLDDVIEIAATLDNAGDNPFLAELIADTLEGTNNEHFRQAVEKSNMADLLKAKKEVEAETSNEDEGE